MASPAASASLETHDRLLTNSLTNGGLNIAPRYLHQVGDLDLAVLGSYLSYPVSAANLAGTQVSLQMRLSDRLQVLADLGHSSEVGLRGPIVETREWAVGWDAHYRSDLYFLTNSGMGLSSPMFGMVPFPGGTAQGMELGLNTMRTWGSFDLYLTPVVSVMSNRSMAGLDGGLDWSFGRLGLGYGLGYRRLLFNPDVPNSALVSDEVEHSLGLRFDWTSKLFSQLKVFWTPGDSYGLPMQGVMAGIGLRLLGNGPKPVIASAPPQPALPLAATPEPLSEPEPDPVAVAEALPTPAPQATAKPRPVATPEPAPRAPREPVMRAKAPVAPPSAIEPPPAATPIVPPVLAPIVDQTRSAGEAIVMDLAMVPSEGTDPRFSASGLPPGLVIDPKTGTISGTIAYSALGEYLGTVTMTYGTPDGPGEARRPVRWTIGATLGPFAGTSQALGPFAAAQTGPFAPDRDENLDDAQARDALQHPDGDAFSIEASSGKLPQDKEAANGAAASVAIVVCCLLLLTMGSRSDDE